MRGVYHMPAQTALEDAVKQLREAASQLRCRLGEHIADIIDDYTDALSTAQYAVDELAKDGELFADLDLATASEELEAMHAELDWLKGRVEQEIEEAEEKCSDLVYELEAAMDEANEDAADEDAADEAQDDVESDDE
jgi:hypothetical protein